MARGEPRVRIAFGDEGDPRVRAACATLAAGGLVQPVLVLPEAGRSVPTGVVAAVPGPDDPADPLAFLAGYVASGGAEAGIAGALSTSAEVIRAGIRGVGATGLVVGCFSVAHQGRRTTYADCSVIPEPSPEQLAEIGASAADHHRGTTGEEPRVALLSFSTRGSASHPAVDRVRTAAELLSRRRPDLLVEGEMQFDVAVDPAVAARKLPGSAVAGRGNVLVFPSLDAANIAYKTAERLGGARAIGCFVLHLAKPWVDLSRGCSERDIVDAALMVRHSVLAARTADRPATAGLATG